MSLNPPVPPAETVPSGRAEPVSRPEARVEPDATAPGHPRSRALAS